MSVRGESMSGVSINDGDRVIVTRAGEKLRQAGLHTSALLIFIRTSHFRGDQQYSGNIVVQLDRTTDSTTVLLAAMARGLASISISLEQDRRKPVFVYWIL
ncbi:hypothetical protein H0A58_11395 [Alcaligenaceae bacterium]|nr:hypothetical protein [Alcaligenaceae bacterium]